MAKYDLARHLYLEVNPSVRSDAQSLLWRGCKGSDYEPGPNGTCVLGWTTQVAPKKIAIGFNVDYLPCGRRLLHQIVSKPAPEIL